MIIIDRFEGEYAVLENDDEMQNIERTLLPDDAKEGDVLIVVDSMYEVDVEGTQKRREEVIALKRMLGL